MRNTRRTSCAYFHKVKGRAKVGGKSQLAGCNTLGRKGRRARAVFQCVRSRRLRAIALSAVIYRFVPEEALSAINFWI